MTNKVRYYLERPQPGKECLITLHYKYKKGEKEFIRLSTNVSVLSEHWDKKRQRAKETLKTEYAEINQFLDDLANEAHRIVRSYRLERKLLYLTADKLRGHLKGWISGEALVVGQVSLRSYFKQFISDRKSTKAVNSIKQYKSTNNHFENFCKSIGGDVDFNDVNLRLFERFRDYFWQLEPAQSDNNVHKHLSTFKLVLEQAKKRDIMNNDKFRYVDICKDLGVCKCTADSIALYLPELRALYNLELPRHLDYTRDLFIIGCFTGLRVSDWASIRPNKIIEKNGIKSIPVWTQKTAKYVNIPLHPYVVAIIEKYDYQFPTMPRDQVINRHLKEIGRLAGFVEKIDVRNRYRGQRVPDEKVKYTLISSHTARRSFATNAYLSGDIPQSDIMIVTGHSSTDTFMKYVKLPKEESTIVIAASDFFKV